MTVEVKELEYCKLQVSYTADSDVVLEKREEALETLKRSNPKVRGFRNLPSRSKKGRNKIRRKSYVKPNVNKGKLFDRALKTQFKSYIEKTVISELVSEGYDETLYETKVKPIGYPEVSNHTLDSDNFSCEMLLLHKPSFNLTEYKEFDIPSPEVEDAVVEAEAMVQKLREQHADVLPFKSEDFVQMGDSLTMDIKTLVDEKKIDSLTKEGLFYTVGSYTNEEFDNNLLGMKAGDKKSFTIDFPDGESINPSLREKKAIFEVEVHMGTKKVPAPLDDELAKKAGAKTIQELRQHAEATASQRIDVRKNIKLAEQVMKRLVLKHEFEVPAWLALAESKRGAASLGKKWDDLSTEEILSLNEAAKKQVKLSLILDSIREEEPSAVFSEKELVNQLKLNLETQGYPDAMSLMRKMQVDGSLIGHIARIRDEATVQWIIQTCNIVE